MYTLFTTISTGTYNTYIPLSLRVSAFSLHTSIFTLRYPRHTVNNFPIYTVLDSTLRLLAPPRTLIASIPAIRGPTPCCAADRQLSGRTLLVSPYVTFAEFMPTNPCRYCDMPTLLSCWHRLESQARKNCKRSKCYGIANSHKCHVPRLKIKTLIVSYNIIYEIRVSLGTPVPRLLLRMQIDMFVNILTHEHDHT